MSLPHLAEPQLFGTTFVLQIAFVVSWPHVPSASTPGCWHINTIIDHQQVQCACWTTSEAPCSRLAASGPRPLQNPSVWVKLLAAADAIDRLKSDRTMLGRHESSENKQPVNAEFSPPSQSSIRVYTQALPISQSPTLKTSASASYSSRSCVRRHVMPECSRPRTSASDTCILADQSGHCWRVTAYFLSANLW
ncbi:hypothetical protein BDP81DRAFT_130760 [Colletotrichum phormii]|uniref:Uncharacterized protein n=1 Tax=Colletotrichum phormii TaxID=359342 RepID=A0AAI9ZZU2_9PEZI|nr:uncharacterized protein BDP81DRAFT_130760 [Colletotrichum phormii]KAK1641285.1 hypothetical protein BDP81DRAFT_130760 [Colletotrichum phormii]